MHSRLRQKRDVKYWRIVVQNVLFQSSRNIDHATSALSGSTLLIPGLSYMSIGLDDWRAVESTFRSLAFDIFCPVPGDSVTLNWN